MYLIFKLGIIRLMAKIISQIVAAILGIGLAVLFVPGVIVNQLPNSNFFGIPLTSQWQIILLLGIVLGLLNLSVKPALNAITLPLRIITLGFFGIAVNMALIWILDFIFKEITIPWLWPILWTTVIVWFLNITIPKLIKEK